MAKSYYVANEDYALGCSDSLMASVDLSGCTDACFVPVYSPTNKIKSKKVLESLTITVTAATGLIKTSLIDGAAVTFVSAAGNISGSSTKYKADKMAVCLADSTISGATIKAYTGEGSHGTLTVVGTNATSGATVTDVCDVWIKDAGQSVLKAV